ncbi:MAG: hypothetical protein WC343_02935 [Bacilli bacterium]|jgi:hypothetical protein
MTPEEQTAGTLAAVELALKGATIKHLIGSIGPDGVILVESLAIRTVDGDTLGLAAMGDGFTISRMDRAAPAKSVFDLIKRGSLCPSCVGTHPEDPTGGEICYIRQVSIHEAPAECPDFESRKDPDDPCFGCPGVEGGCSEHPAECGRSAGRDA